MAQYTKKVMEHFLNPKNMGKIKDADGVGEIKNPVCGDITTIFIKVAKKKSKEREIEYIKDVKFKTLGCAAAIATSSVATEIAKGKSLDDAKRISSKDIISSLGTLPAQKVHCSLLALDALKKAIENYENKNPKKYL